MKSYHSPYSEQTPYSRDHTTHPPELSTMGYLFSDWCLVLAYYGVESKAKDLLESYLSNRKQFVQIWEIVSKIKPITIGVPQGSVIGPLLLNILSMI